MAGCDPIKRRLDSLIELRKEVVEELHQPGLSSAEHALLVSELKQLGSAIAAAKRELEQCQTPTLPRPDLEARSFIVTRQGQTISVAGVIVNRGEVAATGPFKVTLGVTLTTQGGLTQTRQLDLEIPPSTTIEGFDTTFVTEPMTNIPLVSTPYVFEMIVDADQQLSESIETNNFIRIEHRVLLTTPVVS